MRPLNDQPASSRAVLALIRDSRGRVLLVRRGDDSLAWNLSGGSIEMMAESAEVAVTLGARPWLCGGGMRSALK